MIVPTEPEQEPPARRLAGRHRKTPTGAAATGVPPAEAPPSRADARARHAGAPDHAPAETPGLEAAPDHAPPAEASPVAASPVEAPPGETPPAEPIVQPTRVQRRWREWPIGLVLTCVAISLLVVAANHFRRGSVLLAASVLLATGLRLVLPARQAGLLAVRSRLVDVIALAGLGGGLMVLALVVPPPS